MQEHDLSSSSQEMEGDEKLATCASSSRGRVLVRSHAMREETSPPREPNSPMISPSIMVIPSTESASSSPKTAVLGVLSPTPGSRTTSPGNCSRKSPNSPRKSPRNSPNKAECCSSESSDEAVHHQVDDLDESVEKKKLNASHNHYHNNNNNHHSSKKKLSTCCDCSNPNCTSGCARATAARSERNINNNLSSMQQTSPNTLSVGRMAGKAKMRHQHNSSSQGSFDGSASNSPCLSRDSSAEQYTDTSGIDLELFIPETLNRNAKDRAFMLRIEQELVTLAKDRVKTHYKFPPMSSYQRMLVHRCAAYFGMEHNIESSGKCVVVNKTKNTRIPEVEFKEHIKEDLVFAEPEPRRSILKRDSNSCEEYGFKSPDKQYGSLENNRRSKSFEEREEEYEKVRRRIFNRELMMRQMHDGGSSVDDFEWAEIPWSSTDSECSSRFRLQLPEHARRPPSKLIKVLSEETGVTLRPYVAKSHSFGGYGGILSRGDSVISTHSAGGRLLTKQDSGASSVSWRLSPSSSGYKSQSQMSESITPSPTSTPHNLGERQDQFTELAAPSNHKDSIVWAVTDMQSVPKGSIIIDPQTGAPIKNEDGTLYHYDPENPPMVKNTVNTPPPPPQKKTSPKKHRVSQQQQQSKPTPLHLINSATSPSLPYSPQLQMVTQMQSNRAYQQFDNVQQQQQQQVAVFNAGFGTPQSQGQEPAMPMYQPCIVYAPTYGITPQFDNRMEAPPLNECYISDMSQSYPPPFWSQQPIAYYQNPQPANPAPPQPQPPPLTHQRYSLPLLPSQGPNFVTPQYQNYLPPMNQPPPPPPQAAPPSGSDLMPYQQLIYQPPSAFAPTQPNYGYSAPNNGLYPMYPANNAGYPQAPQTPSMGHDQNVMQLAQNMSQFSFVQQNYNNKGGFVVDMRPKCGNNGPPKNMNMLMGCGSSQSSTGGTNSPAGTVVAAPGGGGYCPSMYKTPPDTPPNFQPHFRQMNTIRANTPNRANSSPSPAGDVAIFDRQKMPPLAPPTPQQLYHGMPYVLPEKTVPNRAHQSAQSQQPPQPTYRTFPPGKHQSYASQSENRQQQQHKIKKGNSFCRAGNKMSTTISPNPK